MATFNFSYAPGTTIQQMVGMEIAGRLWSSYLNDPVTVNIHVAFRSSSSFPTNVIGGALPGMRSAQKYTDVYNALRSEAGDLSVQNALNGTYDARSFDDKLAVNNLSPNADNIARFYMQLNGVEQMVDMTTSTLNLTRANAKALGLSLSDASNLDGFILFSDLAGVKTSTGQAVSWNYNYTGTPTVNTLDYLSTAVHEIGHILGFVSGIDRPGWLSSQLANSSQDPTYRTNISQQIANTTPLDLFRFSTRSLTVRDMTYGSNGGAKFFSINQGRAQLAEFGTGLDTTIGGDGNQASHWKESSSSLMAPKLATATRAKITATDLRAMDVIGWDLEFYRAGTNPTGTSDQDTMMLSRGLQNASAVANTAIDLSALQSQSVSAIATRANQTTTWVNNNFSASPTALVRDRTSDINSMIQNSQIYNWGSEGGDGFWQKIFNLFRLEGRFSTVDEEELATDITDATTALEPLSHKSLTTFSGQPTSTWDFLSHLQAVDWGIELSPVSTWELPKSMQSEAIVSALESPNQSVPQTNLKAALSAIRPMLAASMPNIMWQFSESFSPSFGNSKLKPVSQTNSSVSNRSNDNIAWSDWNVDLDKLPSSFSW